MLSTLPRYVGYAWRADSGFRPSGTAGDVVRFETGELGNDLGISLAIVRALDAYPASAILWVTRTRAEAMRYGDAERFTFAGGDVRVLFDEPDGTLVIVI